MRGRGWLTALAGKCARHGCEQGGEDEGHGADRADPRYLAQGSADEGVAHLFLLESGSGNRVVSAAWQAQTASAHRRTVKPKPRPVINSASSVPPPSCPCP